MIVNAEITAIELKKTRAGGRAVNIALVTDCTNGDPKWKFPRDFIGETAPDWVTERWWALINQKRGWDDFFSINAFDLIGVKFSVELEWNEEFKRVKVKKPFVNNSANTESTAPAPPPPPPPPPAPTPQVVPQDDIPF